LNQKARKTGEDQEFLEAHGFVASKFESHSTVTPSRLETAVASDVSAEILTFDSCFESLAVASHPLQPAFLSDNLDRSR
jgi:hypothetical protein